MKKKGKSVKSAVIWVSVVLFAVSIFLVTSGCCCNPADIQAMKDNHLKSEKDLKAQIDAKNNEISILRAEIDKWRSYYKWLEEQTSTDRQKYLDALNKVLGNKPATK